MIDKYSLEDTGAFLFVLKELDTNKWFRLTVILVDGSGFVYDDFEHDGLWTRKIEYP
jgi:hypothetical protein